MKYNFILTNNSNKIIKIIHIYIIDPKYYSTYKYLHFIFKKQLIRFFYKIFITFIIS